MPGVLVALGVLETSMVDCAVGVAVIPGTLVLVGIAV